MRLWLERGERTSLFGRRIYLLSAAIECNERCLELIGRHRIGNDLVWLSPSALALTETAEGMIDRAADLSRWSWSDTKKALRMNLRGLRLARASSREAAVRVVDLIMGTTLESRSVGDLVAAEAGLRGGFDDLARRVVALASFETGAELVLEPEPIGPERGVEPSKWVRMTRR